MTVVTYEENVYITEFQTMFLNLSDISEDKFISYFDEFDDTVEKSQINDVIHKFLDENYYMFNHQEAMYHTVETESQSFIYSEDESFYEKYDTDCDTELFYYDLADYKSSIITVDTDTNKIVELTDMNPKSSSSVLKLTENQIEYFYHKINSVVYNSICHM